MKSNDTILLEKAYEQIFKNYSINEDHHDESKFKLNMDGHMAEALGEDVYSLPKQNFNDAIGSGNLKEMSWYIQARHNGYEPKFIKIVDIEDDKIHIEDQQREYTDKYIGLARKPIHGIKYEILDYNPKTDYLSGTPIHRDDLIIGPIEDEEVIYKVNRYIDSLINRSRGMHSYFKDEPNVSLD